MSPVFPVSEVMLEEALRQIAMNHDTTDAVIGRPYFASFMMWNHALTPVNVVGYGPYMPSKFYVISINILVNIGLVELCLITSVYILYFSCLFV